MRIYHGSENIIENPKYGAGKPYNDYGLGFYCTQHLDTAKEWAVKTDTDGYTNEYLLNLDGLSVLNLNGEDYNSLHWLGVLLQNREFSIDTALAEEAREYIISRFPVDYQSSDVLIGYRADDSYFSFAKAFLAGSISYQQLCRAMKLGKLGTQIVLKSKRAFEQIEFANAHRVSAADWYPRASARDAKARAQYLTMSGSGLQKNGLYIVDILRLGLVGNDARL